MNLSRGDGGDEALELGPHEERLPHLLARQRADAEAAVRLERDETERRQAAERLAHRRAADRVLRGDLLLAQHRARLELAGDDRLFERERDLVGLRPRSIGRKYTPVSVEALVRGQRQELDERVAERDLARTAPSPRRRASTPAISSRTRSGVKRPALTHVQTCAREISAVAASSIRLSIAAAPTPCSHESR